MARIEDELNTQFANDKHRFMANLMFTANYIRNEFEAVVKPFGISQQQYNILRILRGAGDWLNMTEVKHRMVEKSPNATRLCDKLFDKKLIERRRSTSDRRVVYLKISAKGLELLAELDVAEAGPHGISRMLERLNENDARTFSNLLDELRD